MSPRYEVRHRITGALIGVYSATTRHAAAHMASLDPDGAKSLAPREWVGDVAEAYEEDMMSAVEVGEEG